MMEDGIGTGDLASQSGDHGVTIDPNGLERIEVVRGPATLLYGSNAVGGVVNAVTPHESYRDSMIEGTRGQLSADGGTAQHAGRDERERAARERQPDAVGWRGHPSVGRLRDTGRNRRELADASHDRSSRRWLSLVSVCLRAVGSRSRTAATASRSPARFVTKKTQASPTARKKWSGSSTSIPNGAWGASTSGCRTWGPTCSTPFASWST